MENHTPHTIDDPDMSVRRIGYWILNRLFFYFFLNKKFLFYMVRFERWDALYMWIY